MYVCVCNAYRESQLREAIEKAAGNGNITVEQIYARLGRGPRCGRCVTNVRDLLNAKREAPAKSEARN